jgi:hypothetical protein
MCSALKVVITSLVDNQVMESGLVEAVRQI